MSNTLVFKASISIKASPEKVWDALTNPEKTVQYMYGCEIISDWAIGSALTWRGTSDGVIYVTGKVIQYQPHSILELSSFDPNADYPDIPENHLYAVYELVEDGENTVLNITQKGFDDAEKGKERFEQAHEAWDFALNGLKNLCEE